MNHTAPELRYYMRQWIKKSLQLAKWRCHLQFNLLCQKVSFIPPSLRIRDPVKNPFSSKATKKFQLELLEARVQGSHSNIRILSRSVKGFIFNIQQLMPLEDLHELVKATTLKVQNQTTVQKNKHISKLTHWKRRYDFPDVPDSRRAAPPKIINLSTTHLPEKEANLLELGLQYIPPPKPDIPRIIAGVEGIMSTLNHSETFKVRNAIVQTLLRPDRKKIPSHNNKAILNKLKSYKSLVFTRADKGNHPVIMDRSDYIAKMKDILQDSSFFSSISPQENTTLTKMFKKSLNNMKKSGSITTEQYTHFTANLDRSAYIYGIPKVHKPGVPLRPIIAYHQSPAYAVSKYQRKQRLFEVKPFCPCFDFVSHRNGGSTNLHQVLCEKRIQGYRNFLDVANSLWGCRHEPKTSFRVIQALQGGSGRDRRQRAFRETVHINHAGPSSDEVSFLHPPSYNAVLVPKDLTFDQKNDRKVTASLNLEATTDDPELLKRTKNGFTALIQKLLNRHLSGASKMSRDQGIVHHEFQQQGSTITADSYLGDLRRLREAIRQKRPEL
ncbi:hypothetical protein LAZ67_8002001 [Cordylochernes scorpioides]|uniref:Uncharacterized protein n=1 Tax=Cordylochernes scorpioides TaxID=51811 RepID=A0ABY6KQP3_9ARAC|nr:hypothetical protein LAZ67_8002001 [Cordylochernes scorpioides]